MTAQVVIAKPNKLDWRRSKEYGELKWKLLVDSTITNTSDISVGVLKIKPNHSLALHSHSPKELYIIKTGKGLLLKPEKNEIIKTGDVVFISENAPHGVRNIGKKSLIIYWIFQTDCWEEVKYNFTP